MTLQSQNNYNKAMQERLTDLGYLASGNATGYFGDMTKKALETFQKNNGLSATGTVDSKTLQVMFSSSTKKSLISFIKNAQVSFILLEHFSYT